MDRACADHFFVECSGFTAAEREETLSDGTTSPLFDSFPKTLARKQLSLTLLQNEMIHLIPLTPSNFKLV